MLIEFVTEEEGATMIEYGLILVLILVVSIATVVLLGGAARKLFTDGLPASFL